MHTANFTLGVYFHQTTASDLQFHSGHSEDVQQARAEADALAGANGNAEDAMCARARSWRVLRCVSPVICEET